MGEAERGGGVNDLQVFSSPEFGKIRAVDINGEPWLVGKDVALALGYTNPKKALCDHVDQEDKRQGDGVTIRDPMGRGQHPTVINESGVYSLVFSSKLPKAKEFKRWVTSEVLPSIRKHGAYLTPELADKLDTLTRRVDCLANAMPAVSWPPIQPEVSLTGLAKVITVTRRVMLDMGSTPEQVGEVTRNILNTCGFRLPDFKKHSFPFVDLIDFF